MISFGTPTFSAQILTSLFVKFASGIISAPPSPYFVKYPVYISGTGAKASTNSISGKLETLKVGGISLPDSVKPMVEKILVELANGRLAELGDTLRIDVLEIKEGGLHFEGLAPSTFE